MNDKYIWALLDTYETEKLYAELDRENLSELTQTLHKSLEAMYGDETPSFEELSSAIKLNVIDGPEHSLDLGIHSLQRWKLNTLNNGDVILEDSDFVPVKGTKIYEASNVITLGCDGSYVHIPIGYFTRKVNLPVVAEWIEHTLC